ncbi:MAG: type II toxin-antitoxin system PemK/MazF family toxin [Bryobacteraceae bacterium]
MNRWASGAVSGTAHQNKRVLKWNQADRQHTGSARRVITSNLSRANAPGNVLLRKGEANLPKASVVSVSQILTVGKAQLVESTGKLSGAAAGAVRDRLRLLFDGL